VFEVSITGAIGVGKTTLMTALSTYFEAHPELDIRCVVVTEGADEEPFSWWLDAYINGIPREDGVSTARVSCGMFQMAVTTLCRGPRRDAGRKRARELAAEGATVVILTERSHEDAWRIFMPANREMIKDRADRDIFDASCELWHANARVVGEATPDATILLVSPLETILERMKLRDREAERGYALSYPGVVWCLYNEARDDWGNGPTLPVDATGSPDKIAEEVAQFVMKQIH
jgi:thymidylate kinase